MKRIFESYLILQKNLLKNCVIKEDLNTNLQFQLKKAI